MATTPYIAGESPEAIEANRQYQEAMRKLSDSLNNRKKPFIDPVWAAAAKGFSTPKSTGSFFESLGQVGENVAKAEAEQRKQEQDILQQKVGLAGQGIELQRMRERDADVSKWLNPEAKPAAPAGGLPGATTAPKPGALPGAQPTAASPGAEPSLPAAPTKGALASLGEPEEEDDGGVQIFPPNPSFMTQKDYVRLNRSSGKPLGELLKEGSEMERKSLEVKDAGTTNLAKGKFYASKLNIIDAPIYGEGYEGRSFKIPEGVALELSSLLRKGNEAAYKKLADKYTKGFATDGKPMSTEERAIANKEAETRAGKLGEASAAKEASLEETDATARRIYGSATRVQDYLKESGNYFGIFARPGIVAAVGNLIKEGIQTPTGTLNLAGFEDSMRKVMGKVSQRDLDNVTKAATELAEIELAFTRLYLAKQGAVTEGERKIVRAIPGTTSSSPEVLRTRMELLKSRSQYDMDVADAFRQWQDKNPGRSYLEFERKSDLYKDIKKSFAEETEKIFGGIKAVPTSQRKQEAKGGADLESARKRLEEKLRD
jgi:hypothetical protein